MDDCLRYALVAGKKALVSSGLGSETDAFKALDKQRCAPVAQLAAGRADTRGGARAAAREAAREACEARESHHPPRPAAACSSAPAWADSPSSSSPCSSC